jgi:putative tricarboxylic transport membrane protein
VLSLVTVAAYEGSHDWGDLFSLFVFGTAGWIMKRLAWPRPPLVVGLVVGATFERYLYISNSAFGIAWLVRPTVIAIFALVVWALYRPLAAITTGVIAELRQLGSHRLRISASAVFTAAIMLFIMAAIVLSAGWPAAAKPVPLTACGIALTAAVLNLVNELFGAGEKLPGNVDGGVVTQGRVSPAHKGFDKDLDMPATAVRREAMIYFLWLAGLLALVAVIGFIPAIAVFIFAWMHLGFGERRVHAAVCGVVTALLCWGLFHKLIAVAWPQSLLGDLFPALRDALGFI